MDKVRIGVIGIGNMGTNHADSINRGDIDRAELAAVCDVNPGRLKLAAEKWGDKVLRFDSPDALIESGAVDAVFIVTPHYDHPPLAIKALKKGLHTLVEKPAGVYTKQVREMNEAAASSGKVFGLMFNQRTNPIYQKVKDIVQSGELGELKRTIWIITNWYRAQSYYDSGDWRATWAGEGGGVLVNQCPHQLDLWQWICGMPVRVRAFASFGKYHDIEVEDDVTAYVEYENGATGVFITTTGEAPGTNRLEISGDRGKIVVENDELTFWRLRVPERQFNREWKGGFGSPECWECKVPIHGENLQHKGILRNWVNAILDNTPLIAPGAEGIRGVEISNAIHLSAWTDSWVDIPVDEIFFYGKLQEKIKNSTIKKERTGKVLDVDGTY